MSSTLSRVIAFSVLIPMALSAQLARQHDPTRLANWPAPLYWQPSVAPEATATPEVAGASLPVGPAALVFVAMSPCRVMDTRQGQGFTGAFGPPSIGGGLPVRTIPIQSSTTCSIPSVAQAYSFNVTVVPSASLLYITLYPATANPQPAPPNASTLNDPSATIVANAAIVPAGTDGHGGVNVYASSLTDLIIDINGYYAPPGDLNGNTALGTGALAVNTTGASNTATGANALQDNTTGSNNTASGQGALGSNTTGGQNTATGADALGNNTTGVGNTANGYQALMLNSTGNHNTATGTVALANNTTAVGNTADGFEALTLNTTGNNNAATGYVALSSNTTGASNTADGSNALANNTTGGLNTASGASALGQNTTGNNNTAIGAAALIVNTTGGYNTASGTQALNQNSTGSYNTAAGFGALEQNTTGSSNIAIGNYAAYSVSGANGNNIHIGSQGAANDNNTIRIGAGQASFFAAGIRGATTGNNNAIPVVIDSMGQLGTVNSSRRFKEDIHDMGDASAGLLRLRPVTFRYRQPFTDGSKPVQFGLIAEEVEEVYPDLVAHSADGQIESVKYQVLDSMLLNEVQKQAEKIRSLEDRLAALETLLSKSAGDRH